MIDAIFAGFMIGVGAIVNVTVGGLLGPFLFSVGLITILIYELSLFTGKAGLLATREITLKNLSIVWIGNLLGTWIAAVIICATPFEITACQNIIAIRQANSFLTNVILGVFCGVLMNVAVTCFKLERNPIYTILPVAVFILSGYNHCVADMFYSHVGATALKDYLHLIPTTIGNIIGCCLLPFGKLISKKTL